MVSKSKLFASVQVGEMQLQHRIVMAPLTRFRADDAHVPTDMMVEYYSQRASTPGTLLITEATFIARKAGGFGNVPGIWSEEQAAGWKKVTDAVHAHGSYIYLQLWALGRDATPSVLHREASELGLPEDALPYISASSVPADPSFGHDEVPRSLTEEEIDEYVDLYAAAAKNAVENAEFDGVEVHGANSYLLDQFLQDVTNKRTDAYGGTIEKRCLFPLRVVDAIVAAIGPTRTGIRLSPFNRFSGMRMADPYPTFSYFVSQIRERHPRFAYIHGVEGYERGDQLDFMREIWRKDPAKSQIFFSASRHNLESAIRTADEKDDLVVFGRHFIANPDLPLRFKNNIPLTPFDVSTFYSVKSPKGYTDYPFSSAVAANGQAELPRLDSSQEIDVPDGTDRKLNVQAAVDNL